MMKRVEDYVADIPMEIGKYFFPRSEICLPSARLPVITAFKMYSFAVEIQAREMYENRNAELLKPVVKETKKPSSSFISTEVLQPTRIADSVPTPLVPSTVSKNLTSFADFETKANVFDELEWSSIDNRAALSQVLGVSSEPSTPASQGFPSEPTASKGLPSYPSLFSKETDGQNTETKTNGSILTNNSLISSTTSLPAATGTKKPTTEDLYRERLLKKGYRVQFVDVALRSLPRQRWVHIEYYIKAMSTLNKQGVSPTDSISFLNDCKLVDKQAVLDMSQEVAKTISSGTKADEAMHLCLEKVLSRS